MKYPSTLKNVQLYPSDTFKIVADNLARKLFEMDIVSGAKIDFELLEIGSKKIKSKVTISNGTILNVHFWEFDWAVFDAIISLRISENDEYTTAAIICRKLGASHTPTKELQKAVIESLEKFAAVRVVINMENTKKIYDSPIDEYEFRGYFLASESLTMSVNGQSASLIHFLSKGMAYFTAEMKDQIITTKQEYFNPPIRMTMRSIAINHFLLRRINEMKGTLDVSKTNKRIKPLRHTILLDSLYKACELENAAKFQKQDARQTVVTILNYYIEKDFIKGYEFETGRAGKIRAIHFEL